MPEASKPRNAQEALEQGYIEATPDEIAKRREIDLPGFEIQSTNPDAANTGDYVCRRPNSEGVTCFIGDCHDGIEYVWVCRNGICMDRAFWRPC